MKWAFIHNYRVQLVGSALFFILIGILIPVLITTYAFTENIESQNDQNTLAEFAKAEENIKTLLEHVNESSLLLQHDDDVQELFLVRHPAGAARTQAKLAMLESIRVALSYNNNLAGVLFWRTDTDQIYGSLAKWNFFSDDARYAFTELLMPEDEKLGGGGGGRPNALDRLL